MTLPSDLNNNLKSTGPIKNTKNVEKGDVSNKVIEQQLLQDPEVIMAQVTGDGYHYQLHIVSDVFIGKRTVARQQWVYSKLKAYITSGSLHALSMKTFTRQEWDDSRG